MSKRGDSKAQNLIDLESETQEEMGKEDDKQEDTEVEEETSEDETQITAAAVGIGKVDEGRVLRNRGELEFPIRYQESQPGTSTSRRRRSLYGRDSPVKQLPLMVKGKALHCTPWSFMDLTGLIQRLPNMCEGGQKWITQFKEKTAGQHLAIGDIKAILCQTVGKGQAEEILSMSEHGDLMDEPKVDPIPFGLYRQDIWNVIRDMYLVKMDTGKLETVKLQDNENVMTFVQSFQDKWRDETGDKWDSSQCRSVQDVVKKGSPRRGTEKTGGGSRT